MADYDFITSLIRFSYSSVSTFETCAYSWKLNYIDKLPRVNNFFSDYGSLMHTVFEKFFRKELETWELAEEYRDNYEEKVKNDPPPFPQGMAQKYKAQGQDFFDNFDFNIDDYDILGIEDTIDFNFRGHDFTARPDLILMHKETSQYILVDYKSSTPLKVSKTTGKETWDKKKIEGYHKQLYIYAYAIRNYKFIPIDKIRLWFPRLGKELTIQWDMKEEEKVMNWLEETIVKIKAENKFPYNNTSDYFCNNLCGVRMACKFRK